jgi:aspartate dehydrogenase
VTRTIRAPERLSIAGLGSVGRAIVARLRSDLPGYRLSAVAARDKPRAYQFLREQGHDVPVLPIEELGAQSDVVVECLPPTLLPSLATSTLQHGADLLVLSVGALLDHPDLVDLAWSSRGRILVPSGAIPGLDAIAAAAVGTIYEVRIVSRKPPSGLAGAPFFATSDIQIDAIDAPTLLAKGPVREVIRGFPSNLNVSVAVALAGIGPDRTQLEIWADPGINRNMHTVSVDSDSCSLSLSIENIPSENPRTGRLTALSVVSLLQKRHTSLVIGS